MSLVQYVVVVMSFTKLPNSWDVACQKWENFILVRNLCPKNEVLKLRKVLFAKKISRLLPLKSLLKAAAPLTLPLLLL